MSETIFKGFTRDDAVWVWSKFTGLAALIATGVLPLDGYLSPQAVKVIQLAAVVALYLGGQNGNSPLPGRKVLDPPVQK
jgi:hypothetical protein